MVVFLAGPVLVTATVVWAVWRIVLWRRRQGPTDLLREAAVAALFAWSLVVADLTLFPMRIIFYDWSARFSLVPLQSILQLIGETSGPIAFRNIVGNVVLFVPFGVLLPLLFARLRPFRAAVWRFAVLSAVIELTQLLSRARSVDVDDVLLNTTGALLGWAAFSLAAHVASRWSYGRDLLDRVGVAGEREPLLTGVVPIALTAVLTVPFMVATIAEATVNEAGVAAEATEAWGDGRVEAVTDVGRDRFVVAAGGGETAASMRVLSYNRVFPGRYSLEGSSNDLPAGGSGYAYGITPFNVVKGELPTVYVWGVERVGAATLRITGNGLDERVSLPDGDFFVAGFTFEPGSDQVLEEFVVRFLRAEGTDVTHLVPWLDG